MLAELLGRGEPVRFVAQGRSMWPFNKPGDLVSVSALDGPPHLGEVVFAERSPGDLILHRVVGVRPRSVRLRGDHCTLDDGWLPNAALVGRLSSIERAGRAVPLIGAPALLLTAATRRFSRARERLRKLRNQAKVLRGLAERLRR